MLPQFQKQTKNELNSNNIRVIFQDSRGIIWFGYWSDGVNRFDGKNWSIYTTEDGLADKFILAISEDREATSGLEQTPRECPSLTGSPSQITAWRMACLIIPVSLLYNMEIIYGLPPRTDFPGLMETHSKTIQLLKAWSIII